MENISVKLPDGSIKQLPKGSTGLDLALSIGPGLAKDAVAIEINNIQKDLSDTCLLYTSPSPRDLRRSRMPSSA